MSAAAELQAAIVPRLKGWPAVAVIVAGRVYDDVPRDSSGQATAEFPFVSIADFQEITDDADCIAGGEIFVSIDAWSRAVGYREIHHLAAAVKAALHNAPLDLGEAALVSLEHTATRTMRDPDDKTRHAVIEFRALVETP